MDPDTLGNTSCSIAPLGAAAQDRPTAAPWRPVLPRPVRDGLIALLFLVVAIACHFPVTFFDTTTYKNLTDLKPEVVALYQTFPSDPVDTARIERVTMKLEQAYEYEKGKGSQNNSTLNQFDKLRSIFRRAINNRVKNGPWTPQAEADYEKNMVDAFDIAIQSENLKNKER